MLADTPPIGQSVQMAAMAYADACAALRTAVPEFGEIIDEHLVDYEGELLPHVLFGDLTRFVLAANERGDHDVVARSLTFLDRALRDGDPDVENLVAVSFVENNEPWDAQAWTFISTWPEALLAEAQRQRDWKPTT